jgi:flagellar FliJ protein
MARPFSLAGLLRLRKLQEDQAAAEVSVARARAAEVASRQKYAENSLASFMSPNVDSESMRWTAAARASTASALAELDALDTEWTLRTEDARARHAAARANALGLEKLEARHNAAATGEELRAEQAALDEIAARAWKIAQGDGSR